MKDIVLGALSAHAALAWLGLSLMGIAMLAAIPGVMMIKRRGPVPTALLCFSCGMIISGAMALILSTQFPN